MLAEMQIRQRPESTNSEPSAVWPLTGRDEELRLIDAALRRSHQRRGVVLAGAAGTGKTRLAREALSRCARRGATVHWIPATASSRAVPLGAFAEVVNVGGQDGVPLVQRAVRELTSSAAGRAAMVLAVDDAHLLDDLSAMLVHHLVRSSTVAVIVTLRSNEPAPDAVTSLWKDGYLERLDVQPLSRSETVSLVESVLGGPVDGVTANWLFGLARGSALYLRQLVEGGVESGRLRMLVGVWRWDGPFVASQSLAELVESRMGTLAGTVCEVVDLLAFGEPLPLSVLASLCGSAAVEQAEARGVAVVANENGRVQARLAHPLYGELRRLRLGRLQAAVVSRRLAHALAGEDRRDPTLVLRRATLALDADTILGAEEGRDLDLYTAATHLALEFCEAGLAVRFARAALSAGGGFEVGFLLAYALTLADRGEEAEHEAAALASQPLTGFEQVLLAALRAENMFHHLGRTRDAMATLDDVADIATEIGAIAEINAVRATFAADLGRPVAAIEAAATSLSSPPASDMAVVVAAWSMVEALAVTGRIDEAAPVVEQASTAVTSSGYGRLVFLYFTFSHVAALQLAGYLDEAESVVEMQRADDRDWSVPGLGPLATMLMLGTVAQGRGQLLTAQRRLREALAGFRSRNQGYWEYFSQLRLTLTVAMTGDGAAAEQELAALNAVGERRSPDAVRAHQPELILTRAWVEAAKGVTSSGIALARDAATCAATMGQPATEVLALHTAVCFGERTVAERLTELADIVDGPRAPAAAAHATALAADDGAALMRASDLWTEIGDMRAAADAAAQAVIAFVRNGLRGSANTATMRARALADACENVHTPALRQAQRPLPITGRQREIAVLVSQGLTNQQIGERLMMSVRTVEGHIYRACTRFGVNSRTELAALISEVP